MVLTHRARQAVEAQVQECVDDLQVVTESLAQGVNHQQRIDAALDEWREALAIFEAALAIAQKEERAATQQVLHDALAGLPNRTMFDDRQEYGISLA